MHVVLYKCHHTCFIEASVTKALVVDNHRAYVDHPWWAYQVYLAAVALGGWPAAVVADMAEGDQGDGRLR